MWSEINKEIHPPVNRKDYDGGRKVVLHVYTLYVDIIKYINIMVKKVQKNLPSESTSYASEISLNRFVASSGLSGFLSGCHLSASFLYLKLN